MSIAKGEDILNKEDICKFVSMDTSYAEEVCSNVIDSFLSSIIKGTKGNKRIKLREFGSFINKTKYRKGKRIDTISFVSSCVL